MILFEISCRTRTIKCEDEPFVPTSKVTKLPETESVTGAFRKHEGLRNICCFTRVSKWQATEHFECGVQHTGQTRKCEKVIAATLQPRLLKFALRRYCHSPTFASCPQSQLHISGFDIDRETFTKNIITCAIILTESQLHAIRPSFGGHIQL